MIIMKRLSNPIFMTICILLLTACSKQEMHEFADAHPILMVIYGLALLAAIIAAVVGIVGLVVSSVITAAFYVFTFFLPFNLNN